MSRTRGTMISAWILALIICMAGPGCDKIKELTGGGKKVTADKSDDDDDDDDKGKDNDDDDDDDDKDGDKEGDGKGTGSGNKPAELGPKATLREVVEAHQGYEKCLAVVQRALPPDLGKDLLGYVNIPDGLCRTREAMKKDNPQSCNLIRSYALKKGCRTMYALYRKKPNECYLGYPKRRGRDGYCLALATRNINLCRAARTQAQEVRCRAIIGRNPEGCGEMTKHSDRQECKDEVKRWRSEIGSGGAEDDTGGSFKPKMELSLKLTGGTAPLEFEKITSTCADFGAVIPSADDGIAQVNLCEYYTYSYRFNRGSTMDYRMKRIKIDLSFKPPASVKQKISFGTDASFGIRLSNYQEFKKDPKGTIRFSRFERKRGGRVTGTFKVTVSSYSKGKLTAEGKFDTFVRDLVDPSLMKKKPSYIRRPPRRNILGVLGKRPPYRGIGGLTARGQKKFAALRSAATFTESGKGMKMTNILYGSIWTRLGLRNFDVLISVGGQATKTKSSIVRVRSALRKAKTLKIKVNRGGSNTTFTATSATLDRIRAEFAL